MSAAAGPRPPLDVSGITVPQGWRLEHVDEVGSTNAVLADRARAGEAAGVVLVAERQTAGRGRLGRDWVVAPGSSLVVSVLLQPDVPAERWAWLPLLTGLAVARAVSGPVSSAGGEVRLKWPNDVLVDGPDGKQKVCGILLERVDGPGGPTSRPAAVVGVGLNVAQSRDELPVPTATSLALAGAEVTREQLLVDLLAELRAAYDAWVGGADLRDDYLAACSTVGRDVRVTLPAGELEGRAVDVDPDGRLVVRTSSGDERLGAGDVVHVRRA